MGHWMHEWILSTTKTLSINLDNFDQIEFETAEAPYVIKFKKVTATGEINTVFTLELSVEDFNKFKETYAKIFNLDEEDF